MGKAQKRLVNKLSRQAIKERSVKIEDRVKSIYLETPKRVIVLDGIENTAENWYNFLDQNGFYGKTE